MSNLVCNDDINLLRQFNAGGQTLYKYDSVLKAVYLADLPGQTDHSAVVNRIDSLRACSTGQ